jgi:hypothetical protein
MCSEIIESVADDNNYDDFSSCQLHNFPKFSFHYFEHYFSKGKKHSRRPIISTLVNLYLRALVPMSHNKKANANDSL